MRRLLLILLIATPWLALAYYGIKQSHIFSHREKKVEAAVYPVTEQKPLVIIIPSYKNAAYYERNLRSVFEQKYDNYRVIYIDDCSPDGTYELVKEMVEAHHQEHRFTIIHNEKRVGAMANIYRMVNMCDDHEIVVTLDGDDSLAHPQVLQKINETYADPDVWIAYSQLIMYPEYKMGASRRVPSKIIKNNTFRKWYFVYGQVRSYYAALFKKIKIEDLQIDGHFLDMTYDVAIMMPMMEMAGIHHKFIPDVLYVCTYTNPISDHVVNHKHQLELEQHIRSLPPYIPLKSLFNKKAGA